MPNSVSTLLLSLPLSYWPNASLCGAQNDPLRHLTHGQIAPQRNQQLARQRYDHGLADVTSGACSALAIPLRQRTVLLEYEPAPSQLHQAAPHPGITGP